LSFPEPCARLVTGWGVLEWTAPPRPWRLRDFGFVLVLGMLPWLHRKYALYVLAIFGIIMWRRRTAGLPAGTQVRALLTFAMPPLVLGLWTLHYWGNLAGGLAIDQTPFSLSAFTHGVPGMWLDRENG